MPGLEILGIFDNLAKLVINPTMGRMLFGKMLKIASKKGNDDNNEAEDDNNHVSKQFHKVPPERLALPS